MVPKRPSSVKKNRSQGKDGTPDDAQQSVLELLENMQTMIATAVAASTAAIAAINGHNGDSKTSTAPGTVATATPPVAPPPGLPPPCLPCFNREMLCTFSGGTRRSACDGCYGAHRACVQVSVSF